jgi:acyl carrier protein
MPATNTFARADFIRAATEDHMNRRLILVFLTVFALPARSAVSADNIEGRVKRVIAESLQVDIREVVPRARLTRHFYADSLDVLTIAISLEEEFKCKIPDEKVECWVTVGDVINFIRKNANKCK